MDVSQFLENTVEEGTWVGDLPGLGDIELLVVPASNLKALQFSGYLFRKMRPGIEPGQPVDMTFDEEQYIEKEVIVQTGVRGWRNVMVGDEPLEFSKERLRQMMASPVFENGAMLAVARATQESSEAERVVLGN